MSNCRRREIAFTLVELLIVVGIIGVLIGLLLPSLARARAASRTTLCAANLHQLSVAFFEYAANYSGKFPPNGTFPSPGMYWYDDDRIGHFLPASRPPLPTGKPGGGVYICPEDPAPAFLSYSMNEFASSAIDSSVLATLPAAGVMWTSTTGQSSKLMLLAESYSQAGSPTGWYAMPTIGTYGVTAATRFGGNGGLAPPIDAKRFQNVISELCFMRHRIPGTAIYTQPIGRLNIAFADGHVSLMSDGDLVNKNGTITGKAYWSPADWGGH